MEGTHDGGTYGGMYIQGTVHTGECMNGGVYSQRSVHIVECTRGGMYPQ